MTDDTAPPQSSAPTRPPIRPPALDTRAVHAGNRGLADGEPARPLPAIELGTTHAEPDARAAAARMAELSAGGATAGEATVYARLGDPVTTQFEAGIAELEGTAEAVAFASGMAAVSACLLAAVAAGRPRVVALRPLYGATDHLLSSGLLGTATTWVGSVEEVAAAVGPETGLVVAESPANPTLDEHDLAALAAACAPAPLLVDNTFATPVLQRPAELGAALVLHSATKFIGGHDDVLGGVVACGADRARALRRIRVATGGVLGPFASYLLLRGLATLPLRVRAASATAAELARRLADEPGVAGVRYPGLAPDRPKQMAGGGALLAFDAGGRERAEAVQRAVRLITPAPSLGGVRTLLQHPASVSHASVPREQRLAHGITDGLLRLSVGLEDVDDLWADLAGALRAGPPPPGTAEAG